MVQGHVFLAISVDGFVARKDHSLDWLNKQESTGDDHGYSALMDKVDGLIMGTGSYKTVLGFGEWPYPKPVAVLSRSMNQSDIPDDLQDKVRVMSGSPADVMGQLEQEGWRNAYVDGARLVQSFIKAGLISEMALTVIPILIGDGFSLFGELDADIDLKLAGSESYPNGFVQLRYQFPDA